MVRNACLTALIVCGLLPMAEAHEWPLGVGENTVGYASSTYSHWHYWAPTLYRLRHERKTHLLSLYASDRYPWVPSPVVIVPYPQPAIPPGELYLHTGLPYDPARLAVAPRPLARQQPRNESQARPPSGE
jgi:hypothetical protein